ncbi:MAG: GPP34 family phosphoprotein, partial [Chloroflexota bacterium]|nr:GPP34 family phosphoprotein [Chloroflexota bacterium]
DGWPEKPWRLSAPESYVLLHGPKARGNKVFALALMELVARGAFRIIRGDQPLLMRGPRPARPDARPLAAIWDLRPAGKPVADVARAAKGRYGSLRGYVEREVLAALAERGLYRREAYKILWIFPASRHVPTPAGEAARAELEAWRAAGTRGFGELVRRDPARAAAFVGLAGGAILLMEPLRPDLQALRQRLQPQRQGGDGGSGADLGHTGGSDDDDREPGEPGEPIEPVGLPAADPFAFDFDPGAFDSLDSVADAIGSGVDSGGDSGRGDGGGDSGGGDGGGGGGGE